MIKVTFEADDAGLRQVWDWFEETPLSPFGLFISLLTPTLDFSRNAKQTRGTVRARGKAVYITEFSYLPNAVQFKASFWDTGVVRFIEQG